MNQLSDPSYWLRLFPRGEHRFRMALRAGDPGTFWGSGEGTPMMLSQRCRWLEEERQHYFALIPEGAEIAREALKMMAIWSGVAEAAPHPGESLEATCVRAAALLEPDWVILSAGREDAPRVLGGVVIFPSSWSLIDKLGQPLRDVHGPVPTLQAGLGGPMETFFNRLEPGVFWERDNWGLSGDMELNHHPTRPRGRLASGANLDGAWLRLERQFLARLPESGGILFGIKVSHHLLRDLADMAGVASGLASALETMDVDVASYKGLTEARMALAEKLRECECKADDNTAP